MTCLKAQSLITPFINDELDMLTLEEFMNHINHCEECREELEVYYTLLTGMKQLDDDKNLSGDFHLDFVNKLKRTEDKIKRKKQQKLTKRIALLLTILIFGIITSFSIKEYVVEDIIGNNENEILKESEIHLRYYFYREKESKLQDYMKINYNKYRNHFGDIYQQLPQEGDLLFEFNNHKSNLKSSLKIHQSDVEENENLEDQEEQNESINNDSKKE